MKNIRFIAFFLMMLTVISCSDGQKRNSNPDHGEIEQAVEQGSRQASEQVEQSVQQVDDYLQETTDRVDQRALESSRQLEMEVDSIQMNLE